MKEIKSILNLYESVKEGNERAAIAQVVRVEESSYRREGARMLVFESGVFEGGISGGCLEGDALKRSQMAILKQQPSVVTYDTSKDDENQIGVGLGCNGIIDVLISPINQENKIIPILKKCLAERKAHAIVTVTELNGAAENLGLGDMFYLDLQSRKMEDCSSKELEGFVENQLDDILDKKRSRILHMETDAFRAKIFVELLPAQFHLAIYGDNYDVYPMLDLAKVMDWDVSLVGNLQKLKKEKLRDVKNLYPKDSAKRPSIDNRTAVVLMAHDFKTDTNNLKNLLDSEAPYIACLGPRKRYEKMLNSVEKEGFFLSEVQEERVFAPCGLEIGANTPEEIAASVFTEILSVFSNKKGGMLRDKVGPIHERY
ncbi:MAG: XdhC family protein [Eudoraea sp.]|nr:XdhC family protein [Eudoraea sp.]